MKQVLISFKPTLWDSLHEPKENMLVRCFTVNNKAPSFWIKKSVKCYLDTTECDAININKLWMTLNETTKSEGNKAIKLK